MTPLTLDQLRETLPPLDELRPVFDHVLATSTPPEGQRWASSALLGTAGGRIAQLDDVLRDFEAVAEVEARHLAAIHELVRVVLKALAADDRQVAAEALLEAAGLEEGRDRFDRAFAYADAAHRTLSTRDSTALSARAERRRARAARFSGRFDTAFRDYSGAYARAQALGDTQGAAEAAIGAGNVLEDQALWNDAEAWYGVAVAAMDRAGYDGAERWQALLNIHVVLRSQGRLAEAAERLAEARHAASSASDESALPFLENAEGQWLMADGSVEEAIDHLTLALAAAPNSRARVIIRLNLAEALHASGRTLDAAEEARRAERDAIAGSHESQLPEVYRLLGRLAADAGSADAFVLFERALSLIERRSLPRVQRARTLQMYAEAERTLGRHERASELAASASADYQAIGIQQRAPWAESHPAPARWDTDTDD